MRRGWALLLFTLSLRCGGEDFSSGAAGSSGSGGSAAAGGTGGGTGGTGGAGAGSSDASSDSPSDATESDAGSDAPSDAPAAPDAEDGCTPTTWYPDADEDGFGRSSGALVSCDLPGKQWATEGGDCNDDDPLVNPGQTNFFDVPYESSGGQKSFDYDCSGSELGDPSQFGAAANCGLFAIGNCNQQGFLPANIGTNPICGSKTIRKCVPELGFCKAEETTVATGKRCR